jgi:hypothetical protein
VNDTLASLELNNHSHVPSVGKLNNKSSSHSDKILCSLLMEGFKIANVAWGHVIISLLSRNMKEANSFPRHAYIQRLVNSQGSCICIYRYTAPTAF